MSKLSLSDMDVMISRLTAELHLDVPSLGRIAHKAVHDAYAHGLKGELLKSRIADAIEDGLASNGEGLHRHLNAAAIADWRGICARAFDKALNSTFNTSTSVERG